MLEQDAVIFSAPTYDLIPPPCSKVYAPESGLRVRLPDQDRRRRPLEQAPEGKWKFVIAENGLEWDRTIEEGRGVHCDEIAETQGVFFMDPKKRQMVANKLSKYKKIQLTGI